MKPLLVAFLVYGDIRSTRDALTEEKYKDLAQAFLSAGYHVKSVLYRDEWKEKVYDHLLNFDAILVWVNPVEEGKDRKNLDMLLTKLAQQGKMVSAHPELILKMGTKDILFKTKEMDWGGNIKLYSSYEDFKERFSQSLIETGIKILKQYRGNGGNGVFKISGNSSGKEITVVHAQNSQHPLQYSWDEFYKVFSPYFSNGGVLIEQEWNRHHVNGMVRCYLCGNRVAGFGYQEINALYEIETPDNIVHLPPSKRFYFTENCGLFADLKELMENKWVHQLLQTQNILKEKLPVIWDADFFINHVDSNSIKGKYTLCEINVSSVSPFPPSAIRYMVEKVGERIGKSIVAQP